MINNVNGCTWCLETIQDPLEKVTPDSKISKGYTSTSLDSSTSSGSTGIEHVCRSLGTELDAAVEDWSKG